MRWGLWESTVLSHRVCPEGGGHEVRGQPSLRSSSPSISVAFFSSSLMCSSRSTSCSWWDQKWGGQVRPPQWWPMNVAMSAHTMETSSSHSGHCGLRW